MKRLYVLLIAAPLVLASCNEARRDNDSNLNEDRAEAAAEANTDKFAGKKQRDANFVEDVIETNYSEVKLAELASQKSRTPRVKQLAEMIKQDHTSSLNEIKTLAQAKAISVPVEESAGAREKIEDLAEKTDKEFDKAWCKEMKDVHDEAISKFEKRLEDTEDEELKAFINKTLPVLRKHHEQLEAFDESQKEKKS